MSEVNFDVFCNGGNGLVDRISGFPDQLLCHILAFLPIKQAFITTLLSKRWTPLCYSLPLLIFDYVDTSFPCLDHQTEKDDNDDNFYRFCRFVNALMLSPLSTNQRLKKFRLSYFIGFIKSLENCKGDCHLEVFKACLEAAKRRGVEDLHLSLSYHTFKPTIFISQTVVVLRHVMLYIASDTSSVDLPSLKALDLRYVFLKNRNDYLNFLSGCRIIQDLHVDRINIRSKMHRVENNAPEEGLERVSVQWILCLMVLLMSSFFV